MNKCAPTCRPIDQYAISIPKDSGLPPCLYIAIAARDTNHIESYVGRIVLQLTSSSLGKALLVEAHEPEKADGRLAIWDVAEAVVTALSKASLGSRGLPCLSARLHTGISRF